MARITPPKPHSRADDAGILARIRAFRADMFRSQPERLYRAKMARMRTPFLSSVLLGTPDLVREVLERRPEDFPKASIIGRTLSPLLGASVFVTNGALWQRQRRIIDPAFASGRLKTNFAAMQAAGTAAVARLEPGLREMEFETAHLAADVIFRTLFSIPITEARARGVFDAFQAYQRAQPLLSPLDLIRAPAWLPRRRRGARHARVIRTLLAEILRERAAAIAQGNPPDDLATALMTTPDPESGTCFSQGEMVDQAAIFFLAGHETSASALAWALYCLASDSEAQEAVAREVEAVAGSGPLAFEDIARLRFTRDVFREVLRLYPPVPMMVREAKKPECFRDTDVKPGTLCILSPWHLHRHERLWAAPDQFDPWRWQNAETKALAREAYLPFSKGARVCSGAGFAMLEGVLLLAMLVRAFRFEKGPEPPVPVAHLTVRSEDGIRLRVSPRGSHSGSEQRA